MPCDHSYRLTPPDLQQTPATSAKVSIKIVATDNYVFAFSSPTARDDQAAITNTLRQAIEAHKARGQPPPATSATNTPTPNADGQAQSAAMTFAKAASGASGAAAKAEDELFNDARLLAADLDIDRVKRAVSPMSFDRLTVIVTSAG